MEITYSYQNDCLHKVLQANSELKRQIRRLKDKCLKLEEERNEYMQDAAYDYLFKKYVGLYNKADKSLIVHHFVDHSSIFPYGNASYIGEYDCATVLGSWDNWSIEHHMRMKCVRDEQNRYEGYVYYITLNDDLKDGDICHFKFKDRDGEWIEPNIELDGPDEALVEFKQDSAGIWNAVLPIRL